jgi:hypothetical protein
MYKEKEPPLKVALAFLILLTDNGYDYTFCKKRVNQGIFKG